MCYVRLLASSPDKCTVHVNHDTVSRLRKLGPAQSKIHGEWQSTYLLSQPKLQRPQIAHSDAGNQPSLAVNMPALASTPSDRHEAFRQKQQILHKATFGKGFTRHKKEAASGCIARINIGHRHGGETLNSENLESKHYSHLMWGTLGTGLTVVRSLWLQLAEACIVRSSTCRLQISPTFRHTTVSACAFALGGVRALRGITIIGAS